MADYALLVPDAEQLVTDLLSAFAVLERALVQKAVELGQTPDREVREGHRIEHRVEFFDNAAHVAIREAHGQSEAQRLAQGGWEGVTVTGSIDAHLPGTDGVIWDITLERRASGWAIHRWLTLYLDGDPAIYFRGRREVSADFPEIEVADSPALIAALPSAVDELLATPVPYPGSTQEHV